MTREEAREQAELFMERYLNQDREEWAGAESTLRELEDLYVGQTNNSHVEGCPVGELIKRFNGGDPTIKQPVAALGLTRLAVERMGPTGSVPPEPEILSSDVHVLCTAVIDASIDAETNCPFCSQGTDFEEHGTDCAVNLAKKLLAQHIKGTG